MEGKCGWQRSGPRRGIETVALCVVVVLGAGGVGCSDHRISLAEFLAMEQEMQQVATTQPVALPAEVTEAIDEHLGPYKVGPGDVLSVSLMGTEQTGILPPTIARVTRDGEADLPIVGLVKVTGLELEDVETAIRQAYVPKVYREVVVHVEPISVDTTNVLVLGAVQAPGLVALRRTERNLLFAIVGAGGASEASSGQVTLQRLRRPAEEVMLNLRDPEELRAALALNPLEDGDILKVHAAMPNTIFVGGLVNGPRPQVYAPGVKMTMLQVIAASGGLRTDVTPRDATLMRRMPDGRDVQVKLDMDRISAGGDPNITLAGGDILWVNETIETKVQDWINRNIFFRAGVSATAGANYGINYSNTGLHYLNDTARQREGAYQEGVGTLQDRFDPFGFLLQPVTTLTPAPATTP